MRSTSTLGRNLFSHPRIHPDSREDQEQPKNGGRLGSVSPWDWCIGRGFAAIKQVEFVEVVGQIHSVFVMWPLLHEREAPGTVEAGRDYRVVGRELHAGIADLAGEVQALINQATTYMLVARPGLHEQEPQVRCALVPRETDTQPARLRSTSAIQAPSRGLLRLA